MQRFELLFVLFRFRSVVYVRIWAGFFARLQRNFAVKILSFLMKVTGLLMAEKPVVARSLRLYVTLRKIFNRFAVVSPIATVVGRLFYAEPGRIQDDVSHRT